MAESKESQKSFSQLLRGAVGPGQNPESPSSQKGQSNRPSSMGPSGPAPQEKRKRPILLPFGQKEGEGTLLSVSYKEWAFLLGALLLLFGGMGLIRTFGPKESANPSVAPFSDGLTQEDVSEGLRPAGAGDEEVVSPLSSRDTTRLVQPPPGYGTADKKAKPKGPLDNLKDSLWGGMKEAERRTPPRPSLGGMGPSLAGALAGMNGGPPSQGGRMMSPEEISARLSGIPRNPSGGTAGQRLGYSGAQRVPGLGGGRRSLADSSAGPYGKMREAYQGPQGPESAAARAGEKFGEDKAGGSPAGGGHGAGVDGETPKGSPDKTELGNYKIERPQWAMREWELAHRNQIAMEKGLFALSEGFFGGIGKGGGEAIGGGIGKIATGLGNFVVCRTWDDKGCKDKAGPNLADGWVRRSCDNSAFPPGKYEVSELRLVYGAQPGTLGSADLKGTVTVVSAGTKTTKKTLPDGKEEVTQEPDVKERGCLDKFTHLPVQLTQTEVDNITAYGRPTTTEFPAASVASVSKGAGASATTPTPGAAGGPAAGATPTAGGTTTAPPVAPAEPVAPANGMGFDRPAAAAPASGSNEGETPPDPEGK